MSHILICIYRQNKVCSHAHSGISLCLSVLIFHKSMDFFQKSRTRLHAFMISPAQNPFSPFIGIFLTPNFQMEDSQQVGEPPPKPRIDPPHTQASRPLNRSMATRHSCADCSAPKRNTFAHTGVCTHVHARTHRHTGTHVHTEIGQYTKHIHVPMMYTYQHTDTQAHTHSTSIIWRCREAPQSHSAVRLSPL